MHRVFRLPTYNATPPSQIVGLPSLENEMLWCCLVVLHLTRYDDGAICHVMEPFGYMAVSRRKLMKGCVLTM